MRISELVPFKKTPAYSVAKQEIDQDQYVPVNKIARVLRQQGFKVEAIGEGLYAQVFYRPGDNYVIKIFKDDPGYLTYLKFILQNQQNPHVPKIRGKFMKPFKDADIYVVRMELLRSYKDEKERSLIYAIDNAVNGSADDSEIIAQKYGPQMEKILNDIRGLIQNPDNFRGNDIHTGNVLFRTDGTPVITDPLV